MCAVSADITACISIRKKVLYFLNAIFLFTKKEEGTRFSQEFHQFTTLNGVKVDQIKYPVWCGTTIDLHEIFQTVKSHGGFTEVT